MASVVIKNKQVGSKLGCAQACTQQDGQCEGKYAGE